MAAQQPHAWLRGPVAGIPAMLQPAAHGFINAREEALSALGDLSTDELWQPVHGAASVGFHCRHFVQAADRLLTYAAGRELDDPQRQALADETKAPNPPLDAAALAVVVEKGVERALIRIGTLDERTLLAAREVGRAKLPSTVLGLAFHAAEHAQRHSAQAITTSRILKTMRGSDR